MKKQIYTITDPRTGLVFYVGASINVENRAKQHMMQQSAARKTIDEIFAAKLKCIYSIVDEIDEDDDWRMLELEWIFKLDKEGHPLCNIQKKGFKTKDYMFEIVNLINRDLKDQSR